MGADTLAWSGDSPAPWDTGVGGQDNLRWAPGTRQNSALPLPLPTRPLAPSHTAAPKAISYSNNQACLHLRAFAPACPYNDKFLPQVLAVDRSSPGQSQVPLVTAGMDR